MQITNIEQGSFEWLEFRRSHIGASDIGPILGISPWKTPYKLWLEKTGKIKEDEPSYAMFRGVALEPEARLKYSEVTKNDVMAHIVVSDEWKVAMASLDGITIDHGIICEIKCPGPKTYEKALKGEIPDYYRAQIQWQLYVCKAKKCDYFVYLDEKKHVLLEVYPDPKYQKELVVAAKEFWVFVESGEEPEISEKDYVLIEDTAANNISLEWKSLKAKVKAFEEKLKELEKQMLSFTDDGNCFFPKSSVQICRVNKKGSVDWKELCVRWKISEEEVEKFRRKSIGYARFSVREKDPLQDRFHT